MPDVNQPDTTVLDIPGAARSAAPEMTHQRKRPGWPWAILAVLVVAGGAASWWLLASAPQQVQAARPPMPVPVMIVKATDLPVYRSFPAVTQAMRMVTIQARVTGYLAQQAAVDGADVAAGALLYRIDPKDYQMAFAEAQAQRAGASASLRYARVTNGRNQVLARDGWVSRDTADQTQSNFNQGQASVANNGAAVTEAALNLSRTEIRAPFAGRISASQVFQGSLISVAGATLNTLVQLDPIYVSFNPAENDLAAITREQGRAPIQTDVAVDGSKPDHKGALTFIDNQVSQSTGTILLRATIANPDRGLLPGQYVTARLHLGDLPGALLVPQSAVGTTQIGRSVMVVAAGNRVAARTVTLGDTYDENIVVLTGLKAGDRVITGQLQKLKPGMQVDPTEQAAQ
jgi:multidrug efflux system membrane fusion protein